MTTTTPDLTLTRLLDAPRERVYQAFTDPEHFVTWWGPIGNALPLDKVDFDVRPGGHLRWSEVFPAEPGTWTEGRLELTDVIEGELLDGILSVKGELPGGFEPFETRMRIEFHDEADGRTRLEIRQWMPEQYVSPTENGWGQAFSKLDTTLTA